MSSELDSLIEELKKTKELPKQQTEELTEENLTEFILKKTQSLINNGLASVESIKESIQQAFDAEEVSSYADLIRATTQALDTLGKISIQNKRSKTALQLKEMDNSGAKGLPKTGTQVFIATREEVINNLLKGVKDSLEQKTESDAPVLELED